MDLQRYKLKSFTKDERSGLPTEIKLIIMFEKKGFHLQPFLLEDAVARFPECFVDMTPKRIG